MERSIREAYVYDSESECDRLELQASLAGIENHLCHFCVPDHAVVLDAGCGSGSMSRLLAARNPGATVLGLDAEPAYVAYANALVRKQGLSNVSFRKGDAQQLSFADATFDLVWSKYVLYFLPRPDDAIKELRRVTKPGGTVVIALNYPPGCTLDPEDAELHRLWDRVCGCLLNGALPAKLPAMLMRAGFVDVTVRLEADAVYTIVGAIDPPRRRNLKMMLDAGCAHGVSALGSEVWDAFYDTWFAYLDRPDTCTVLLLWIVRGSVPGI